MSFERRGIPEAVWAPLTTQLLDPGHPSESPPYPKAEQVCTWRRTLSEEAAGRPRYPQGGSGFPLPGVFPRGTITPRAVHIEVLEHLHGQPTGEPIAPPLGRILGVHLQADVQPH